MPDNPKTSTPVWHSKTHMIMQTAESNGAFMPEGLYQVYERQGDSAQWERMPKDGRIVWFKTLQSAKEACRGYGEFFK